MVVNGGNCVWNDINWIHYVHNGTALDQARLPLPQCAWTRWKARRDRQRERKAVGMSRLIITDSESMKEHLIAGSSIDPSACERSITGSIQNSSVLPAPPNASMRASLILPVDGPSSRLSVPLATTAAKGSMSSSTPGASATSRSIGTQALSSQGLDQNFRTGNGAWPK